MKISLTPGQAVTIHGWLRARESLTWGDIIANPNIKLSTLLSYNVSEMHLHTLQPDLQAWIKHEKITLEDAPRLMAWNCHPIKDMRADLAELIRLKWTSETTSKLGITYNDFVGIGLTPETMLLFPYTLMGWSQLGFSREHAEKIPQHTLYKLFGMNKQDVLSCLPL